MAAIPREQASSIPRRAPFPHDRRAPTLNVLAKVLPSLVNSCFVIRASVQTPSKEHANPYKSPGAAADARGKLGWLIMLLVLWPIVMAAVGSIVGFFAGRLSPDGVDPQLWNPGVGALVGTGVFALVGLVVGIRKANALRDRLDEIHARREELRHEVDRRQAAGGREITTDQRNSAGDLTTDGHAS
jgi:uncharacterized membrane protein